MTPVLSNNFNNLINFTGNQSNATRINQFGGKYQNGKALPMRVRRQIVHMAHSGMKPSQISQDLKVSHGCVSKILSRFKTHRSIKPGSLGVKMTGVPDPVKTYLVELLKQRGMEQVDPMAVHQHLVNVSRSIFDC